MAQNLLPNCCQYSFCGARRQNGSDHSYGVGHVQYFIKRSKGLDLAPEKDRHTVAHIFRKRQRAVAHDGCFALARYRANLILHFKSGCGRETSERIIENHQIGILEKQLGHALSAWHGRSRLFRSALEPSQRSPNQSCWVQKFVQGRQLAKPWLLQWHNELDPQYGMGLGDFYRSLLEEEARRMGKTSDEIRAWQPPRKTGRKGERF